jgi:hypothetical protein
MLGAAAVSRALAVDEADVGVTAPRPRVNASLGGRVRGAADHHGPHEALPELSGETTLARVAPHPAAPHDFAPSDHAPPGGFRPSAAPGNFAPSAALSSAPRTGSRPSIGVPVVSDDGAHPDSSTASPERPRPTRGEDAGTTHPIGARMIRSPASPCWSSC